jgi:hypothetical protein
MTEPVSWPTVRSLLIAILRGIRPDEAESIVEALIKSGFELIEVPLNSPDPFASIERAFGLGSSLYRPGTTASEVGDQALASVGAYDRAMAEVAAS